MQLESWGNLPSIGAIYTSRIVELIYRHLRREMATDDDMNDEVQTIMERDPSVQRNGKNVEAPGETNTLFKKIDKTYTELREQEDQMYIQRTSGITSQVGDSSTLRDREMIIKNLRAALKDLLQEAEQSLRERTSSQTYGPAICAAHYLKKAN